MQTYPMIALVDDDPDDLMFIKDALDDVTQDFQILPFLSGVAFIDYLNTATDLPVLVVLDYNMPKLNAEDILITMGATPRLSSIKAFILSTGMNPTLKERLVTLGAHCCIAKPTSIDGYKLIAQNIMEIANSIQHGSAIV